ncbi:MAG: hypothetical protein KAS99_00275 [Candidatus Omnitrophica bacterium]|nr:hypothetical protein [Candidatus Omnitrophota bacterium]
MKKGTRKFQGKGKLLAIVLLISTIVCMTIPASWALSLDAHQGGQSNLINPSSATVFSSGAESFEPEPVDQDTSKIKAAKQLTGVIRVHDTAGGGGSGSLMSGPPIYLETEEATYPIINPSSYYADPLWQKLIPLKNKKVDLNAEIVPISPYSGYKGQLKNVEDIKPEYCWGDIKEMRVATTTEVSGQGHGNVKSNVELIAMVENDKLTIETKELPPSKSYLNFSMDLVTGNINIIGRSASKEEKITLNEKKGYLHAVEDMVYLVKFHQGKQQAPNEKEELQKLIDYLDRIKEGIEI